MLRSRRLICSGAFRGHDVLALVAGREVCLWKGDNP